MRKEEMEESEASSLDPIYSYMLNFKDEASDDSKTHGILGNEVFDCDEEGMLEA